MPHISIWMKTLYSPPLRCSSHAPWYLAMPGWVPAAASAWISCHTNQLMHVNC